MSIDPCKIAPKHVNDIGFFEDEYDMLKVSPDPRSEEDDILKVTPLLKSDDTILNTPELVLKPKPEANETEPSHSLENTKYSVAAFPKKEMMNLYSDSSSRSGSSSSEKSSDSDDSNNSKMAEESP